MSYEHEDVTQLVNPLGKLYNPLLPYMLLARLSTSHTKEQISDVLKKKYSSYIVAEEEATRKHFHLLIYHSEPNAKNARQNLRNHLQRELDVNGNEDYGITNTVNGTQTQLTKYVIKEGNYISVGVDTQCLKLLHKQSYKKYKKDEFKKGLDLLRDNYIADKNMSFYTHIAQVLKLKCLEYGQDCNINSVKSYVTTSYIKKNGVNDLAQEIENQIFRV